MVDEPQVDDLIASFHRCRENEAFIETFYSTFMSKSPEVAAMFAKTDFAHQKLMLRQSLLEMLFFDQGTPGILEDIEKLGRRHQELGVSQEMYSLWLDSLCETLRQIDPLMTPELEGRWRRAMEKGIAVMLSVDRQ